MVPGERVRRSHTDLEAPAGPLLLPPVVTRWVNEVARRPLLADEQQSLRLQRRYGEEGADELSRSGFVVEPSGSQPFEAVTWRVNVRGVRIVAFLGSPARYRFAPLHVGTTELRVYRLLSGVMQVQYDDERRVEDAAALGTIDTTRSFVAQTWGTFSAIMVSPPFPDSGDPAPPEREISRLNAAVELGRALLVESLSGRELLEHDERLMRELLAVPSGSRPPSPLREKAMALIEWEHRNPCVTIETMAATLNVSRRHLYRSFQGTGSTVGEVLLQRRIATAAEWLRSSTAASVAEIARESGFGSSDQFRRSFKKVHGVSPTEYRDATLGSAEPERNTQP